MSNVLFSFCFLCLALVTEVYVPQNVSSDVLLEHSLPSACLVPSESFILSSDNVVTAVQTGNSILNPAVIKEQVKTICFFYYRKLMYLISLLALYFFLAN